MTIRPFVRLILVLFGLLLSIAACGTPLVSTPPLPSPAGMTVRITSPEANAQLPRGEPVRVDFTATGGPFLELDLFVDNSIVTSQPPSAPDAQMSGTLVWENPTDGAHTLRLQAVDVNKNIALAEIQVQIGPGITLSIPTSAIESPTSNPSANAGMQIRFVDIAEGGTVLATLDEKGMPIVMVRVEVSGLAPLTVDLTANDMVVPGEYRNVSGGVPFIADIKWSPMSGGGEYTLVASAITEDKQFAQASVRITVTGVPAFTPTPPPLDRAAAQKRFIQLYQQLYSIKIPTPSLYRFEAPRAPNLSRWISSVYYEGKRYYIDLYDDTHYELSPGDYADPAHRLSETSLVYCRPVGHYKILVVFVDYGTFEVNKDDALAQVPLMVNWTNQLYTNFAKSQGFASPPLSIEADAVYLSAPPSPGHLLTAEQILSSSGTDPSRYDFVMEIDLDADNTVGTSHGKGILDQGGGIALQGCGDFSDGNVNIWSVVRDAGELQGNLVMDFNHELSHMFGLMENWPFRPASIYSPDGMLHDDWIPYEMFGWTDTDGDGIAEIVDATPYGTSGPQP